VSVCCSSHFAKKVSDKILLPLETNLRNFYPECTSDVFHQKHLVRDYLATMHPYSDPLDTGRTYTQSRLKSGEQKLSNQEAPNGFGVVDFLQPEDPTRPRSVGYSKGHVRNLLKLDVYGEKSSEEARVQREMGRLPPSPNIDRYKTLGGSRGSVSTASTASSTSDQRRPRTTGHQVQSDPLDLYLPLQQQHNTTVRLPTDGGGAMESNNFAVLGLVPATPDPAVHIKSAKGQETRKRNVVPPGTLGYAGPAINKEDVSLVDAHARGVEYFNSVLSRKWRKTQTKLSKAMENDRLKSTLAEARSAMDHIQEFEQNLEIIKSKPRPI